MFFTSNLFSSTCFPPLRKTAVRSTLIRRSAPSYLYDAMGYIPYREILYLRVRPGCENKVIKYENQASTGKRKRYDLQAHSLKKIFLSLCRASLHNNSYETQGIKLSGLSMHGSIKSIFSQLIITNLFRFIY
jgi:hypothetical protein